MGAAPRFDVDVHVTADVRHAPYLLDGLRALEERDELRLRLAPRPPHWRDRVVVEGDRARRVGRPYPWSVDLGVRDHEAGTRRRLSIDLQDWREMYSHTSLRTSDVIVKRMGNRPEAEVVERAYGVRVVPAGITRAGRVADWAGRPSVRTARAFGRLESLVNAPGRLRGVVGRRPVSPPNRSGAAPTLPDLPEAFAFFQVAYHDWDDSDEADRLNRGRADLIRALRGALGERFVGGMTFRGRPRERYEDCVSELPTDQATYLELVRRAAVAVSSNGFGGSPPWKLAEYLEAGACIVTEAPDTVLPRPLEHGRDAWLFTTTAEAADGCARLLDDAAGRADLGLAAAAYYEDQVAPPAAARRFLVAGQATVPCPA